MRVLIDIPEEVMKATKVHNLYPSQLDLICENVLNGTPIPDNATNGDVLKAMFPDIEVEEQGKDLFIVFNMDIQGTPFYKTWWNAPYQKGAKNDV